MDRLIPARESLEVEFKSDIHKLPDDALIDAVVAFANTNGGELYLGVEDDGTVTGLHKDHMDITQLAAFIANRTIPAAAVRMELIDAGRAVLLLSVSKSLSIVASSSGKIQRRRLKADGTPENVPMYPYEINTRLSDLSLLDFSAQTVPGARYDDLDKAERERLRRLILAYNGEKNLLELPDDELDMALNFAARVEDKLIPTYAGMLMIGKSESLAKLIPTAEAAYQALDGTNVTANESFRLPILAAAERMLEFVEARNPESEIEHGLYRQPVPEFDKRAAREAIINAFAHRDYTRLGRVLVRIDAYGLTVSNPGGFIEGVSILNIMSAEPHGRNPALADALKRVGLAERTGRGVDRIFEGSLRYGRLPPDYSETTSTCVKLLLPRCAPDLGFINMLAVHQRRTGEILPLNALLVLNALKRRKLNAREIGKQTNISDVKLRVTLDYLAKSGLIDSAGANGARAYALNSKLYAYNNSDARNAKSALSYHELITQMARENDVITRGAVAEHLGVSPSQAYRLLQKLVTDGTLVKEGGARTARYRLTR